MSGSDYLRKKLDEQGAEYWCVENSPRTSLTNSITGNTLPPIEQLVLTGEVSKKLAELLNKNSGTQAITHLKISNAVVEDGAPLFFSNWQSLQQLELHNVTFPNEWNNNFDQLQMKSGGLVISGSCTKIESETIEQLKDLDWVFLAGWHYSEAQRNTLRISLHGTQVFYCDVDDEPPSTLMHVESEFSQPLATAIEQITEFIEKQTGTSPRIASAANQQLQELATTVGHPVSSELQTYMRSLPRTQLIRNYIFQKPSEIRSTYLGLLEDYSVDGFFSVDSYRLENEWNPRMIPIAADFNYSNFIVVDTEDGAIWEVGESGKTKLTSDLFSFFDTILEECRAGNFEASTRPKFRLTKSLRKLFTQNSSL